MENIPIKFPDVKIRNILSNYASLIGKTYYPGQRYEDTYYTARTRVYSCGTITDHIPKHIYQFEDTYVSAMIINHKGIHSQLIKLKKLTTKKKQFQLDEEEIQDNTTQETQLQTDKQQETQQELQEIQVQTTKI